MPRPTRVRFIVLVALCAAAAIAYAHRGVLSIAESTVRADLGVSETQMGDALGIFFFVYGLFQIPTGMLVDRLGGRNALFLFGMLGAATMALGGIGGFTFLMMSRILMGIAQAGLFPASTAAIRTWFPVERRAFAAGTLTAFMSLGAAFGAYLTGRLLTAFHWQTIFWLYAIPGVVWSVWFFWWFRDRPNEHSGTNQAERDLLRMPETTTEVRRITPWGELIRRPQLYWLCGQQFFRAMANVVYLSWFSTFLQNAHGVPPDRAGQFTAFPLLGVVLGSFAGGIVSDWVLARWGDRRMARRVVAIAGLVIGVVIFGITYMITDVTLIVVLATLAAFFSSMSNPCAYSATIDMGGRFTGSVFSTMNMCGNLGAAIFPRLAPMWVGWFGGNWSQVLVLVALCYTLGLICWWFVDTSRELLPESDDENSADSVSLPIR